MINVLIKRNKDNTEFIVRKENKFGDNKFYGISQKPFYKTKDEIILEISKGILYYTKSNKKETLVEIVNNDSINEKYLRSNNNDTLKDNILELPVYLKISKI